MPGLPCFLSSYIKLLLKTAKSLWASDEALIVATSDKCSLMLRMSQKVPGHMRRQES